MCSLITPDVVQLGTAQIHPFFVERLDAIKRTHLLNSSNATNEHSSWGVKQMTILQALSLSPATHELPSRHGETTEGPSCWKGVFERHSRKSHSIVILSLICIEGQDVPYCTTPYHSARTHKSNLLGVLAL